MKKTLLFLSIISTFFVTAQTATLTNFIDSLPTPGGYGIIESYNNKLYNLPFSQGGKINEINPTTGILTHVATLPSLTFSNGEQYTTYSGNFVFMKGKTVAAISSSNGGTNYHIAAGLNTVDTLLKNHLAFCTMIPVDTMIYILSPKKNLISNRLYVTNLINPITMLDTNVYNNGGANEQIKKADGQKKMYYVTINAINYQPELKFTNGITKQIIETLPNNNAYNFTLVGEINNEMYYTVYHRSPPNNDTTWIKKCDASGTISLVDTIIRKSFASENGLVMNTSKLIIPFKNELSPYYQDVIVYDINTHTKINITQSAYTVRTYNWSQDNVGNTHFYYNSPAGGGIDKTYISDGTIAGTFEYKTSLNTVFSTNFETYQTYQSIGNKAIVCDEYPVANHADELYIGESASATLYKLYSNRKSFPSHFEKVNNSLFFTIRDASFSKITLMKLDGCGIPSSNPLTGVNEIIESENLFSVYPNPTNSTLNIKLQDYYETASVTISNVYGQTILSKNVSDNHIQFDISNCSKGIYFVTVKSENNIHTKKIILN